MDEAFWLGMAGIAWTVFCTRALSPIGLATTMIHRQEENGLAISETWWASEFRKNGYREELVLVANTRIFNLGQLSYQHLCL